MMAGDWMRVPESLHTTAGSEMSLSPESACWNIELALVTTRASCSKHRDRPDRPDASRPRELAVAETRERERDAAAAAGRCWKACWNSVEKYVGNSVETRLRKHTVPCRARLGCAHSVGVWGLFSPVANARSASWRDGSLWNPHAFEIGCRVPLESAVSARWCGLARPLEKNPRRLGL